MTDKYTKEQKIARLKEILPSSDDYLLAIFISIVEVGNPYTLGMFAEVLPVQHKIVVDVHTGVAFTPLYKAML